MEGQENDSNAHCREGYLGTCKGGPYRLTKITSDCNFHRHMSANAQLFSKSAAHAHFLFAELFLLLIFIHTPISYSHTHFFIGCAFSFRLLILLLISVLSSSCCSLLDYSSCY